MRINFVVADAQSMSYRYAFYQCFRNETIFSILHNRFIGPLIKIQHINAIQSDRHLEEAIFKCNERKCLYFD